MGYGLLIWLQALFVFFSTRIAAQSQNNFNSISNTEALLSLESISQVADSHIKVNGTKNLSFFPKHCNH